MIAGFILGDNTGQDNVIVRGIGPSLAAFGIPNVLANPMLELRDSSGTLILANDDWMENPCQSCINQIIAAGLAPTNNLESVIYATLAPGQYTVSLSGVNNGTGTGLVEAYDLLANEPIATPTPTPTFTPSPSPSPTATAGPCMENWDGVTAPALPPGWGGDWVTSTVMSDSLPNNAFTPDPDATSCTVLDRPGVIVTSTTATLSFRNNFNTIGGDGYVLEVSAPNISGGDFLDITDSQIGGTIMSGGYTGIINAVANCLSGRMAWTGDSGGYINTVINLGPNLAGQTVTFRFRMGSTEGVGAPGVHIDNLVFTDAFCP
jgi:hypothetical protein